MKTLKISKICDSERVVLFQNVNEFTITYQEYIKGRWIITKIKECKIESEAIEFFRAVDNHNQWKVTWDFPLN